MKPNKPAIIYRGHSGRVVGYDQCGRRIIFEEPGPGAEQAWEGVPDDCIKIEFPKDFVDEIERITPCPEEK